MCCHDFGIDHAEGAVGARCESGCKSDGKDRWAGGLRCRIAAYGASLLRVLVSIHLCLF